MSSDHQPRNVIIIAYNPQRDQITILEASGIAAAASGKAGGLIALWAYPSCIVPLSFQLHADLAAHHDGADKWGYRRIHSARLGARGRTRSGLPSGSDAGARGNMVIPTVPADLDWLHVENVHSYRSTGTPENTAQVIPYEFTTTMAELAVEKGANVILGRATSIDAVSGAANSVTYIPKGDSSSVTIPATDVVLCAGPWTRSLLPAAPIVGLRQHSVIMRPTRPRPLSGYMLFTEISLATSGARRAKHVTAEIFTRPNNTVWAAGDTDDIAALSIPQTADAVFPDEETCDNILSHVGAISDELGTSEVVSRQACYLPNVEGDVPGPVLGSTSVKGLWIASGHSCWGIQNGPGTGKIMAEFVYDGKAMSADVDELDIRHLDGGAQD
ncbi:d-amino-acid dehydrogenase [Fusarium pseudoanthophilum]|uniref:D-amino-acid dehydrogenase n=1 Tax=Fusarium pseudoanthophilum TaxID=48495 RepID=A0A8H5LBF3_9HYPO|nr:d-amino-acid dehydrogenase [Fusarium pseudoanthophilum]